MRQLLSGQQERCGIAAIFDFQQLPQAIIVRARRCCRTTEYGKHFPNMVDPIEFLGLFAKNGLVCVGPDKSVRIS